MRTKDGIFVEEVVWNNFLKMCSKIGIYNNLRTVLFNYIRNKSTICGISFENIKSHYDLINVFEHSQIPMEFERFNNGGDLGSRTMFLVNTFVFMFLDSNRLVSHEKAAELGRKLFTLCMSIFEGRDVNDITNEEIENKTTLRIPQPRNEYERNIITRYIKSIESGLNVSLHDFVISLLINNDPMVMEIDLNDFIRYINE